jgi:hypothetical protein
LPIPGPSGESCCARSTSSSRSGTHCFVEIAVAHTSGIEGERVHEPDILYCPLPCSRIRAVRAPCTAAAGHERLG